MTTASRIKIAKISFLISVMLLMLFLTLKTAPMDSDWKQQYRFQPKVTLQGDRIQIENFRDFRYSNQGQITEANYSTKQFNLSELQSVWLGLSHFGKFGMAHAFASFEFKNEQFLVVSLEARLNSQQPHYNPLSGLFRNYTKFFVLASEQDVIGLRSHIRKEPVYLYPLQGSQLQAKALLLNFLRQAEHLNEEAEFYNTIIDNCLTGLLAESKQYRDWYTWLDYRILLPGYSDRLLFQNGTIASSKSFEETQNHALIRPESINLDDGSFSSLIRNRH